MKHFTLAEFSRSTLATQLGLPLVIPLDDQVRITAMVHALLDPLRDLVGRPIHITSGWRSQALNRALKGSPTSQHMEGEAADIKADGMDATELLTLIVRSGLPFDQAIGYDPERGGHVHVSFTTRRANRREVLWAPASGGYRPFHPETP